MVFNGRRWDFPKRDELEGNSPSCQTLAGAIENRGADVRQSTVVVTNSIPAVKGSRECVLDDLLRAVTITEDQPGKPHQLGIVTGVKCRYFLVAGRRVRHAWRWTALRHQFGSHFPDH